ncbi:MAG: hypothetical protein AAF627_16350 [Myxococcota bacterium]
MRWVVVLHRSPPKSNSPSEEMAGLKQALHVASALTDRTQLVACALEQERPSWGPLLSDFEGLRLVEEPFERGSAAGLAAAVGRIAMTDRKAEVVVVESLRPPASKVGALQSLNMLQRMRSGRPDDIVAEGGLAFGAVPAWQFLLEENAPELETLMHDEQHLFGLDQIYPYLSATDYRHQVLRFARPMQRADAHAMIERFRAAV